MKHRALYAALPMGRGLKRQMAALKRRRFARWSKMVPRGIDRKIRLRRRHQLDRLGRPTGPIWSQAIAWQVARGIGAGGNVRAVARRIGIPNQTIYRHRRADPHFQSLWEQEVDKRDVALEDALFDRLTNGWEEDVVYQGKCTDKRRVYDNACGLKLYDIRLREARLNRADARADEARADQLAREAKQAEAQEAVSNADDRSVTHRERDLLLVQLMERHRNRHPDEWEDDVHIPSGFDLAQCPAYARAE